MHRFWQVVFAFLAVLIVGFIVWPRGSFLYLERSPVVSVPRRGEQLEQLERRRFDLLVIGGGAAGTGAALDAASRGLTVALVEADDFASGTSSRSTKLIHGGVRYLEKALLHLDYGQWKLVRDALRERKLFLEIAPHLTKKLAIVTPVYSWMELSYIWVGLKIYDWISGGARLGASHYLSASETVAQFPALKKRNMKGAVRYYDGQFNDARMNVALAMTAVQEGAVVANHVKVLSLAKKEEGGFYVRVEDQLNGHTWQIEARQVVNATGPFSDSIRKMDDPAATPMVLPSAGTHLTLDIDIGKQGILIPF